MAIDDSVQMNLRLMLNGIGLLTREKEQDRFARRIGSDAVAETVRNSPFPISLPYPVDSFTVITLEDGALRMHAAKGFTLFALMAPRFKELPQLAKTVHHAIDLTDLRGQKMKSLAITLSTEHFLYDAKSAGQYLADRLFPGQQFGYDRWRLSGSEATVTFDTDDTDGSDPRRWSFAVNPAPDDPSYHSVQTDDPPPYCSVQQMAALNVPGERLPTRSGILNLLKEFWVRSEEFSTWLDARA